MSANTPVRPMRKEKPGRKEEQIERIMLSLSPEQRGLLSLYLNALEISRGSGLLDVVYKAGDKEDEEKAIDALGTIVRLCNLSPT